MEGLLNCTALQREPLYSASYFLPLARGELGKNFTTHLDALYDACGFQSSVATNAPKHYFVLSILVNMECFAYNYTM
mgnify:CR=1 FL=1